MKGQFIVRAFDVGDMTEQKVLELSERGELDALMENGLKKVLHCEGGNLVLDGFAAWTLYRCFSGASVSPFNQSSGDGPCAFATIDLNVYTSEPSYQDWTNCDCHPDDGRGTIGAGKRGYKLIDTEAYLDRFEIDKVGGDGRHEIYFTNEALWTQTIGNHDAITSICINSGENCDYLGTGSYQENWRQIVARIRLKDDKGRNIAFRKTDRMILHVKYRFSLTSF